VEEGEVGEQPVPQEEEVVQEFLLLGEKAVWVLFQPGVMQLVPGEDEMCCVFDVKVG
jgi:hypothetical protein